MMKKKISLLALFLGLCGLLWAQSAPAVVPVKMSDGPSASGMTFEASARQVAEVTCGPGLRHAPVDLQTPLGNQFSVSLWFRANDPDLLGASAWDKAKTVPMTLLDMSGQGGKVHLLLRLMKNRVVVALTDNGGKSWPTFDTSSPIEANKWYLLTLTKDADSTLVYVNELFAGGEQLPALDGLDTAVFGRMDASRFLHGDILQPRFYPEVLSAAQIAAMFVKNRPPEIAPVDVGKSLFMRDERGEYPPLTVAKDELHPLIDQLHVGATALPAPQGAAGQPILLGNLPRNIFGARVALFQCTGRDARGLPCYDGGTTLKNIPGSHFFAARHPDGTVYIYAQGLHTPFGSASLIRYPLLGYAADGMPRFGEVESVEVDGKPLAQALGGVIAGWAVADIDGDGIPDLLAGALTPASNSARYQPDGLSMWKNEPRENSGPGRGYDVDGNWLGDKVTSRLFWAKGRVGGDGKIAFSDKRPVYYTQEGFSVQWRAWERERALNVIDLGGQPTLVMAGDLDKILAMPVAVKDGEIVVGPSVPLLKDAAAIQETYFVHNITVLDKAPDGACRLLLDGNPGHLVVLEGRAPGEFTEAGSLQTRGGPVAVDTLATPARADWDGDGRPDLIVGDASGWLTFWPGTDDPLVYHAGQRMRVDGAPVHHQAGLTGSIQGPVERRWGYLQPTVGFWDGAGAPPVIITNDINATLMCYRRDPKGASAADLSAPEIFTKDGLRYKSAWRSRPAVIPASDNYANTGMPALLHVDWDGDLAVAVPEKPGGTRIARVDKLCDTSGQPVRLSGPAGLWGRTKLAVADWNGDGKWDVLLGSNRSTQNTFTDEVLPGATPLLLENVGSNARPVFRPVRSIRLKDGTALNFDIHTAGVFPTWLSARQNTPPDIIVGAEDGKVYYFRRETLKD